MLSLLWLIPALPFAGFVILLLGMGRISRSTVAVVGVGSVGLATVVATLVTLALVSLPPAQRAYAQVLWTWMHVGNFAPTIGFYLDPLAVVMVLVVTFVSLLIHLYSVEYMAGDEDYRTFFAYMNLFVGSMLTLVLADNLVLLYLGWEGVGLCSYLLIGFWYRDPANGHAARKAFVVTRVGDTAMAIGLFLLFTNLGTLQSQDLMGRVAASWPVGSGLAIAAAALLLGGAVGKSAQLPLQTWLPDAMAGPTPVSALIHAATMVTAGVYLIARTHALFTQAPPVMLTVAIVGAVTLLLAGCSALVQADIKRALAYSTISQIGYMFLALGVGAWSAAIFHFMTHAFFKALLFLAAGAVILAIHHEQDMFKMGGLRTRLPLVFWTFLIGAASLTAVPLVTAGFYSKDIILFDAYASPYGSTWLWAAGLVGALLTALYAFRMVFLTFYGPVRQEHTVRRLGLSIKIPLLVLAAFSVVGGLVELPPALGNLPAFSSFLDAALPATPVLPARAGAEGWLLLISAIVAIFGIFLAYVFFLRAPRLAADLSGSPAGRALHRFWFAGWNFDGFYDAIFVRPFVWFAHADRNDVIDLFYTGLAALGRALNTGLSRTQTGKLRWYAAGITAGAVIALGVVIAVLR